jgi:hypothetical protein
MPAKKKVIKKSPAQKTVTLEKIIREPVKRKIAQKKRILTAEGWKRTALKSKK